MKQPRQSMLLGVAAALMIFGAAASALVVIPDLHGDLVEIGVRPSVLGGTVFHLYFSVMAMFGFGLIVAFAALQSARGTAPARLPLAIIAVVYVAFGVMTFSRSHNPHHLGTLVMGLLIGVAILPARIVEGRP